jgi:hypothetical protein
VLGKLVERYMFISVERYGADFLLHPFVFAMLALTLYGILSPVVRGYLKNRRAETKTRTVIAFQRSGLNTDTLFTALLLVLFIAALAVSARWEFGAKLVPQVVGWAGLLFVVGLLISKLFIQRTAQPIGLEAQIIAAAQPANSSIHFDIQAEYGDLSRKEITQRAFTFFGWCLFYLALAALIGLLPATLIFLVVYMWLEGKERWKVNLVTAVTTVVCSYLVFHMLLHVAWPQALVGDLFPKLRSIQSLNLF